ncbi:MAG: ParB/RepB/Spo0J family partition protein [bacterium]
MSNSGLGRGLDSMLPDDEVNEDKLQQVPVDQIEPDPNQPRDHFDEDRLDELTQSIQQQGVVEPILLRPGQSDESEYVIVAENLTPIAEARAYDSLRNQHDWDQSTLADELGKSRSAVTNRLRLLQLPETIKNGLQNGDISAGHARSLLGLDESQAQVDLYETILEKDLSVRQTEEFVKRYKQGDNEDDQSEEEPEQPEPDPGFDHLEAGLEETLGAPVEIESEDRQSGHIRIYFQSPDEFEQLQERLNQLDPTT